MKLSIITICYNDKAGFEKTAKSIMMQTYTDFEWIIVDGASTDGSVESIKDTVSILSSLRPNLEVHWTSEPDKGIYNAMNKGIRAAHGDYFQFLNSGDWLYDDKVIEHTLPLLKDKDIYVGRVNSVGLVNESDEKQGDYSPEGIIKKLAFSWIPHQASFFHRQIFEEYGFYREDLKIISDWWFYFCSLILGKATIESIPYTIANYDTTGISATHKDIPPKEYNMVIQDYPRIRLLFQFYSKNVEIVEALTNNRTVFFLFRIYYYFHRKFNSR